MQKRNPFVVLLLGLITFGLYFIYWFYVTTQELRSKGADIPHFILFFIPFVSLFWLYKYTAGIEQVSAGKSSAMVLFILTFFLGPIGIIMIQLALNQIAEGGTAGGFNNNPVNTIPQQQFATPAAAGATAAPFAATTEVSPQPEQVSPTTFAQAPQPEVVTPTTTETPAITPDVQIPAPAPAAAPANPVIVPEPAVVAPEATPQPEPQVFQPEQPIASEPVIAPQPQPPVDDQNNPTQPTAQV